jgi:6-phosphofructokinase
MIIGILAFITLTMTIAAVSSIWSTISRDERKLFAKLMGKSALYSAIALSILFVIVNLF